MSLSAENLMHETLMFVCTGVEAGSLDVDAVKYRIRDILSAQHEEDVKKIREFLSSSSVWSSDYIYTNKVNILREFDKEFPLQPNNK